MIDNKKVKELNKKWFEQTRETENAIKKELIDSWIEKHNINIGDDVMFIDVKTCRKINKTFNYYRKAKLVNLNAIVYLESYNENASKIYFEPIVYPYNADNKTLLKTQFFNSRNILKLDSNLLGKEVI